MNAPQPVLPQARLLARALLLLGGAGSGNFGHSGRPGEVGGSSSEGGPAASSLASKKSKFSPEQIAKAYEMKKAGHSAAAIHKATGLYQQIQNHHFKQIEKKQGAIAEKLAKPVAAPAPPPAPAPAKTIEQVVATPPSAPSSAALASKYGYEWKEKTTGPNAGKFAYFKNGLQQSAPFPHDQKEAAAASMHYGAGPKDSTASISDLPGLHIPTTSPASDWPIGTDVTRTIGSNYPKQVEAAAKPWIAGLTSNERYAINDYTGNGYSDINEALRSGKASNRGQAIQNALAKAPTPPPPELVWRGVGSGAQSILAGVKPGDTVHLKGFQSTSINPQVAAHWGHYLLEIKPKGGGYIYPISDHKSEREYLLPHGKHYTVKGISSVKVGSEGIGQVMRTVIQLEMH